MDDRIANIAVKLLSEHKRYEQTANTISLFLCGGSTEKDKELRKAIRKKVTSLTSKYSYKVYFPEDMFIDLILGHQKNDLLSLENLLATSVSVVVLLLNSPGTITELGAFVNYKSLQDKLVVVINPQYKHDRSFINLGPIRYLQDNTNSRVIWSSLVISNSDVLSKHIVEDARLIVKSVSSTTGLENPIWSYDYILSLIYILEPITKVDLLNLLKVVCNNNEIWHTCEQAANAVLSSLVSERKVSVDADIYSTTKKGNINLISLDATKKRIKDRTYFLSQLRLEALNIIFRKRLATKWGKQLAA